MADPMQHTKEEIAWMMEAVTNLLPGRQSEAHFKAGPAELN